MFTIPLLEQTTCILSLNTTGEQQPERTRVIKDYSCSQCFGFQPPFGVEIKIETQRFRNNKVVLTL